MTSQLINETLLRQAVTAWGIEHHQDMAIEECSELISAIARERRGRPSNTVEEIADVMILVATLRLIYGTGAVDEMIAQKMNRLEQKLEVRNVTAD